MNGDAQQYANDVSYANPGRGKGVGPLPSPAFTADVALALAGSPVHPAGPMRHWRTCD